MGEEEAIQFGVDDWSIEAGTGRSACCRSDSEGGHQRADFYQRKVKYAGLEVDPVRQMVQLQKENLHLKQLIAGLTLDKTLLQEVLSPNGKAFAA